MYLINAKTYGLEYFVGAGIPKYAILSHVWAEEEVLFQDMKSLDTAEEKQGFLKIRLTCQQALQHGLNYAWVDTCCINKESSAELSEAINSMFRWYSRAATCYAYLSDVKLLREDETGSSTRPPLSDSVWFTRGWTLQELIAPPEVIFMDRDWCVIGTKRGDLINEISRATGVDTQVLANSSTMFQMSIAKRMSWAANRRTTRKEDEAYCLLGLFDVNMPMLYGEDEDAFVRLQEELIRKTTDQSVFVHRGGSTRLLARSPQDFENCADVEPCLGAFSDKPYELTNAGLRITLPVLCSTGFAVTVVLNCRQNHRRLTLRLQRSSSTTLFPQLKYRNGETRTETLLTCPVEDIFIARHYESYHSHSFLFPSKDNYVCRVWINTSNQSAHGYPKVAIKALEPPELWDVALPMDKRVSTRVGDSARRAYFSFYQSTSVTRPPDVGSVTLDVSQPGLYPVLLGIRFEVLQTTMYDQVSFNCSLALYEIHGVGADHSGFTSHEVDSSNKKHLRVDSGIPLETSIIIQRLKITALLELIPSIGTIPDAFLLGLHVNKV